MKTKSNRLGFFNIAAVLTACVWSLVVGRPAYGVEDMGRPGLVLTDAERAVVGNVLRRAAPADWPAIERSAELEPRILDRSLEALSLDANWLRAANRQMDIPSDLIAQLRTRTALVGIANGRIGAASFGDQAEARSGALSLSLGERLAPNMQTWIPVAYAAMRDETTIVNPLCETGDCDDGGSLPIGGNGGAGASPIAGCSACISGDPYDAVHFRSVAKLLTKTATSLCTGIVLNATTILTAAHCVVKGGKSIDRTDVRVIIADVADLSSVDNIAIPSGFFGSQGSPNPKLDIAILTISGVKFPADFEFAQLPKNRPEGKLEVTIAGFGRNTVFALTDIKLAKFFVGRQQVDFDDTASGSFVWQINAGDTEFSSICEGDSGGPMFVGKTRRRGEALSVAGLIRRSSTDPTTPGIVVPGDAGASACTHAEAELVNLFTEVARTGICDLKKPVGGYCTN